MFSKRSDQRDSESRRRNQDRQAARRQLATRLRSTHRRVGIERLEDRHLLAMDFGDAPDLGVGTGPGDYQTSMVDNGPSHEISPLLFMGTMPDPETDSQPNDGLRNPSLDLAVTATSSPALNFFVTNTTGQPATLYGWIDFNGDGVFDNATERASADVGFATSESVQLQFPEILPGFHGTTYARFRLGLDADTAAQNPTGAAGIGEIEDYQAQVTIPAHTDLTPSYRDSEISSGVLADNGFGSSIAAMGDLDGNGAIDLAVGARMDDTGGSSRGAVHVLYRDEFGAVLRSDYLASGMSGLHELNDFDLFGASVSAVGDLDGNGVTDLLVGAPGDDGAGYGSGAAYLLYLDVVDDRTVVQSSVRLAAGQNGISDLVDGGQYGGNFGSAVAAVGDINGDGVGDFAIAQKESLNAVHLLFMNDDGTVQEPRLLQSGTEVIPLTNEWGTSVVGLGDVDGDEIPDLAVGGVSSVDILFMNSDGSVRSSSKLSDNASSFGSSLAALGDVDGNGVPDLAVGASQRAWVFLLNVDGTIAYQTSGSSVDSSITAVASAAIPLQDDAIELIRFENGELISSHLTETIDNDEGRDSIGALTQSFIFDTECGTCEDRALAYFGKVDASGRPDAGDLTLANIAVGVPGYDAFGFNSGGVQTVQRLQRGAQIAKVIASNTGGMGQLDPYDRFGAALAEAGDLDGDGYTDLFVSAPGDSFNRGAIYVLYLNSASLVRKSVKLDIDTNGISFSELGQSIDVAGDMNGDGIDDLVVSSLTADRTRHQVQLLLMNYDLTGGKLQRVVSPPGVDRSWGSKVAGLGDIDGDSVPDLAVSGPQSSRVDLLFMNQSPLVGSTTSYQSLVNIPSDGSQLFGSSLASVGDMDGNGVAQLAVGSMNYAAVYFLEADGAVERSSSIHGGGFYEDVDNPVTSLAVLPGHSGDNFTYLAAASESIVIDGLRRSLPVWTRSINQAVRPIEYQNFAHTLTTVGDLDGNGVTDVVLGSPEMDALHILFMGPGTSPDGHDMKVERVTEISSETVTYPFDRTILRGGLTEPIPGLGSYVTNIGDLDGDGITDLLVGGGNARVLFLNTDGTVRTTASIDVGDYVTAVTGLGDIDGDGVVDLALGTPSRNVRPDEVPSHSWGGVHILLMNSDGSVRTEQIIDKYTAGLNEGHSMLAFGSALTVVGDIDANGVPDLAVADLGQAPNDPTHVHILLLDQDGSMITDHVLPRGSSREFQEAVMIPAGDLDGDAVPDLRIYSRWNKRTVLFNRDGTVKEQTIDDAGDYDTAYEFSATPLPDLNDDGVNEILIGNLGHYGSRELVIAYPRPEFSIVGDLGDAPDFIRGSSAFDYSTTLAEGGPIHGVGSGLYLGQTVSIDGLLELTNAADTDDDDGLVNPDRDLNITGVPSFELLVTNGPRGEATLHGWLDTNFDGVFDESEYVSQEISDTTEQTIVTLEFPELPAGLAGTTYARFRLSTDEAAALPTGIARDGEVEDYRVTIDTPPGIGATTVKIPGDTTYNRFGASVAWLGDLDGNGFDDFAVGTSQYDQLSVVLMREDGIVKSRVHHSNINYDRWSTFGGSVASIGDLNGDGITDIAVGARGEQDGATDTGAVHILFLNADGTEQSRTVIKSGQAGGPFLYGGGAFGSSVTAIGDLNEDGIVDLAVGASADNQTGSRGGAVYILFMNTDGSVQSHAKIGDNLGGGPSLQGFGYFGSAVAALGDWNGDDIPDLAVGAPEQSTSIDGAQQRDAGAVYLFSLNRDGTVLNTTLLDGNSDLPIAADDRFGSSIATVVGDLDNDGVNDLTLAIGAVGDETGGKDHGAVHVVMMNAVHVVMTNADGSVKDTVKLADGSVKDTLKIADQTNGGPELASSEAGIAWFGSAIAALPDLDENGLPELAIGARQDSGGGDVHLTYLTREFFDFGDAPTVAHTTEVEADGFVRWEANELWERFGGSVTYLGDVNGDDIDDVAVGSLGKNKVTILMLNADGTVNSRTTFSGEEDPSADNNRSYGNSIAAIGDLDNDGISELAVGAYGNDLTGAVHIVSLDSNGVPKSSTKIGNGIGGGPALEAGDQFGWSVSTAGDLNGDGIVDLFVGSPYENNSRGAAYVLFMNNNGTASSTTKIGKDDARITQLNGSFFGTSVASIGDFDGDDIPDLAVGMPRGNNGNGTVILMQMNSDGTVRNSVEVKGGSDIPTSYNGEFGTSIAAVGDLDNDGISELAIGEIKDDAGGRDHGAIHIVFLNPDGSVRKSTKIAPGGLGGGPTLLDDSNAWFGSGLALVGDYDQDGFRDLAVGAVAESKAGSVYAISLKPTLYGSRDTGGEFPSHQISPDLFLGSRVDAESRHYSDVTALADDLHGAINDADGLMNPTQLSDFVPGQPVIVDMLATNTSGTVATLFGWIDFNGNNVFELDERAEVDVPNDSIGEVFALTFPARASVVEDTTYARFRLSTDPEAGEPTGPASDGEVEDYSTAIRNIDTDYGDAPDTGTAPAKGSYNTLSTNSGPSHLVDPAIYLGSGVDAEFEASPSAFANSDQDDGLVDATSDLTITPGQQPKVRVRVTNQTAVDAWLHGWIDYNANGVFDGVTEQAVSVILPDSAVDEQRIIPAGFSGVVELVFPAVPATAEGTTYARFRVSTDAAVDSPTGPAADGEVEDYTVTILSRDYGDAPARYDADSVEGGSSHTVIPGLSIGRTVDVELYAAPGAAADGDDLNGNSVSDEDGLLATSGVIDLTPGVSPSVSFAVTNLTEGEKTAWLYGWIDTDFSGTFDSAEMQKVEVPFGMDAANDDTSFVTLSGFPAVADGVSGMTYARFRLSTDFGNSVDDLSNALPSGYANDGEVEDYVAVVRASSLEISDVKKVEGAVGITPFVFTVTRSGSLTGEVSVDFDTVDGSASVGDDDYVATSGSLTFLDGESSKTIVVDVQGDTKAEASETFLVRLHGVTGNAEIGRTDATGTILDTGGFVLNGIDSGDDSGYSVSSAGDVNNDGYDDIIIGAWGADPNGYSYAGESYVVFGRASFESSIELSSLHDGDGSSGFVLNGIDQSDVSGQSVSGAGDVNNDGYDDIIIGARGADPSGYSYAGESYVVFGRASFESSIELSSLHDGDGSSGFVLNGIDRTDDSGYSVSGAGDVNNDGYDDIIIGARGADPSGNSQAGESYVVFGRASFEPSIELSSLHDGDGSSGFVLNGIDQDDYSGYSVSGAGDVNNDGYDDIIIGAKGADSNGNSYAGESYVVFGRASFESSIELSSLHDGDGSGGFVLNGIDRSDESGHSVSGAGDVNNDGYDDIIIGARGADPSGNSQAGESYVVFGRASFESSIQLSSLHDGDGSGGFVLNGIDQSDVSGHSVSGAGDVNNDGYDDIIIGARGANPNGNSYAGESYVVFGRASFEPSIELSSIHDGDGSGGFVLNGIDRDDYSGYSVSVAGDVNNDGYDDIIIGAKGADSNGQGRAGASYVVFGSDSFGPSIELSSLTPGLKAWVQEATDEQEPVLSIATDAENLTSTLAEIEQLDDLNIASGESLQIVIDLSAGTYQGQRIHVPKGITVVINGAGSGPADFRGASPALTVVSGDVIVLGDVTFTNATDAPTILVQGGSLTLRNSTVEETTTADRPAIQVIGGTVDLGTADDPGGNTIIIHGDGDLIHNTGPNSLSALGNAFKSDDRTITSPFEMEAEITDVLDGHDAGLVSYLADSVFLSLVDGTRDFDLLPLVADLDLVDPVFVITDEVNGQTEILSDGKTVRFVASDIGEARFTYSVLVDDAVVATRTVHVDVTNLPPTVGVDVDDVIVNAGETADNTGAFTDTAGDTVTLSASIGTVTKTGEDSGTWSWSLDTNDTTAELQTVTITATDGDGVTSRTTFSLTVNPAAESLSVTDVTVNDGAVQRSNTTELAIQFDRDFDAQSLIDSGQIVNAVSLHTGAGYGGDVALTVDQFRWDAPSQRLLIDLTAGGTPTILADGRYELRIHSSVDASFVDSDGTDDGIHRFQFHQLQGDFDGDAIVGISDRATWFDRTKVQFGARSGMASYDATFDFDGDGIISTRDYYVWLRACVGKQLD